MSFAPSLVRHQIRDPKLFVREDSVSVSVSRPRGEASHNVSRLMSSFSGVISTVKFAIHVGPSSSVARPLKIIQSGR